MIGRLSSRSIIRLGNVLNLQSGIARRHISVKDIEAEKLLDKIYASVRAQRFEDIVVIQTKHNADPRYLLLASAFSPRHLLNGTETINKHYKQTIKVPDQDFARVSISKDWNVIDFSSIVVHLFSRECRKNYDIEQLWAVGEKYDDLTNFPETSSLSGLLDWRASDSSG